MDQNMNRIHSLRVSRHLKPPKNPMDYHRVSSLLRSKLRGSVVSNMLSERSVTVCTRDKSLKYEASVRHVADLSNPHFLLDICVLKVKDSSIKVVHSFQRKLKEFELEAALSAIEVPSL